MQLGPAPTTSRATHGFTAIELLVVLAIVGILTTVGVVAFQPPTSRLAAQDFQALLQEARMEAIKRNRPVSVSLNVNDGLVLVNASAQSTNISCSGAMTEIGRLDLGDYRGVTSSTTMTAAQMLWLPNGRAQQCNGGLMASTTTFSRSDRAFVVEVSAAGQVRVMSQ